MPEKLNRSKIRNGQARPVKVIQFGEGNFLRAFADWIIDILNEETDFNGGVNIIQPLPNGMGELINTQEGLYHVILNGIENGAARKESRLITAVQQVINPYDSLPSFLKEAENADLRFVLSNTTEAGITFNTADKDFSILSQSFPGKVTSFLYHRFTHFGGANDKGLIFLPCELIEKNGEALKKCILQYAAHWNLPSEFAAWIEQSNTFCNTLVDRIVPGFPASTIKEIQSEIGFDDNLVVVGELFHLWVIEGPKSLDEEFPVSKTNLQVKIVEDLTPYRTRKVRILNGAHTAMVPYAYLKGLRTVQEAIEDGSTREFVDQVIFKEIIPTLELPEEELVSFANSVIERFRNPFIRHELSSIALNSISKFKVRVLPSMLEYVRIKHELPSGLVKSLASLLIFYKGDWQGEKLSINDVPEVMHFFKNVWSKLNLRATLQLVLSNQELWGCDLTQVEGLLSATESEVKEILQKEAKTVS